MVLVVANFGVWGDQLISRLLMLASAMTFSRWKSDP